MKMREGLTWRERQKAQSSWGRTRSARRSCCRIGLSASCGHRPAPTWHGRRWDLDFRAFLQAIGAVDHHFVAGLQTAEHLNALALGDADLNGTGSDGVVGLDEINEGALFSALNGRRRNHQHIVQRGEQHPHVDELAGEKDVILVLERGPELDRARGGIHDVVDGLQRAAGQLGRDRPVEGIDWNRLARLHLFDDVGDVVLGQGEDDRDGMQLGQHHQAGGIAGRDIIALVDQAEADPAVHRRDNVAVNEIELSIIQCGLVGFDQTHVLAN